MVECVDGWVCPECKNVVEMNNLALCASESAQHRTWPPILYETKIIY